jgi:tRNA (guanine-N7-)-methyltransferase
MPQRKKRRQIEREFGVPVAGEILEPPLWTHTSLKHLPGEGRLHWAAVFGRAAPVILDLGCGNGRFLIGSAVWRPGHDHFGLDILPLVIRYASRRANQRGLTNIRFTVADAKTFLERLVEPGSVAEIHCYHPQPYHDSRQAAQRLLTPEFLVKVRRSLGTGGAFFVQTDSLTYWRYLQQVLPAFFEFQERAAPWPDAPKGRTRREIIALRRAFKVYRGSGTARADLDEANALRLAASLPRPDFVTDPRLRELDALEQSSAEN